MSESADLAADGGIARQAGAGPWADGVPAELQDPMVVSRGREPMHTPIGDDASRLDLDGPWRFHWAPQPAYAPA
ncbi:MAG TPA: hypothetical protein VGM93_14940, partial [Acidimicrobiales bacterium]